jgi:uncharacterized phage protein (TIGR01671 family)
MREIKFRAWDPEEKRMSYQDHTDITRTNNNEWEWSPCCITFEEYPNEPIWGQLILMRYIGLKDKNGKEIYEDDIVKDDIGRIFVVGFIEGCFTANYPGYQKGDRFELLSDQDPDRSCGAIGNIYENPELLQ